MTTNNQDFIVYQGDDAKPVITVYNSAGAALDISTVSEIVWNAYDDSGTIKLTKSKTGGAVTFVNTGTDGKIYVSISAFDSAALDGWYFHAATLTDQTGKKATFETGRMLVPVKARGE